MSDCEYSGSCIFFTDRMEAEPNACVTCHAQATPGIVQDWKLSRHADNEIACDACHTRHSFPVKEAREPQACQTCQTCHMGFDHPQWEIYSSSKH